MRVAWSVPPERRHVFPAWASRFELDVRGSFAPVIGLMLVVAVVVAIRGSWILAILFVAMAVAFARLHAIARGR
jgi:hypothetical protein